MHLITQYEVLGKLFTSVRMLIFIARTAFHPLFYALWRKELGRIYFLRYFDTRFYEFI